MINSGISIGDGSVIGAGSIITKDVEPYSIVVGVPGKEIRKRFDESLVERLLSVRWWDFDPDILRAAYVADISDFLDRLSASGTASFAISYKEISKPAG